MATRHTNYNFIGVKRAEARLVADCDLGDASDLCSWLIEPLEMEASNVGDPDSAFTSVCNWKFSSGEFTDAD